MTTTDTTTQAETTTATPVRATWKQHGNPTGGFEFFGTAVKTPDAKGRKVAKVETGQDGIHLKAANGRVIEGGEFAAATKFWAVVPEDAPRRSTAPAEPKVKAEPLPKVVITAAKGGDTTVTPIKGKIAATITASGKSIMAISREFGLNPSQMRRLSLDQVAKVDTVRADLIAAALGVERSKLFSDPTAKAGAKPAPAPATTAPAE
jgi:hypothetical protein